MAAPRLFVSADKLDEKELTLAGAEHHYLSRVLRLTIGDEVVLLDGESRIVTTRIAHLSGEAIALERLSTVQAATHGEPKVTLYLGLLKGERHDLVIEKATELGVRRIVTLCCARSVPDLHHDRAEKRQLRWQRIAKAAAQQCRRPDLPDIAPPQSLATALSALPEATQARLVLYEGTAPPLRGLLGDARGQDVALVIGPEGGLDDSEMAALQGAGFLPCSLGPRVLRAETAALAALSVVLTA